MRRSMLAALLIGFGALSAPSAAADPSPNSTEADAILRPALQDMAGQLGKPVRLQVKVLRTSGSWAFVKGIMTELNGESIHYQGTPFAPAAEHGAKSPVYAGLFRRADGAPDGFPDGDGWRRVTSALGPTDVAWLHWDTEYGAPAALIDGVY